MNCKPSSKLEKVFHRDSSAQHKPTMLISNGVNLIIVLTFSTFPLRKVLHTFPYPILSRRVILLPVVKTLRFPGYLFFPA